MRQCQPSCHLPRLWLVSDARNDALLEQALARLPRGSGFVFRHLHLPPAARRVRFAALARLARARGMWVVLAGTTAKARAWGADGAFGGPKTLGQGLGRGAGQAALLRLVHVHSLAEIGAANRAGADALVLSPAFATRSHPGAAALGPLRWRLLAAWAGVPVIALGGMNAHTARRLDVTYWAAIDGLSPTAAMAILDAPPHQGAL